MAILVVTDMCAAYPAALYPPVIEANKVEIIAARGRGDGIIFLRHNNYEVLVELIALVERPWYDSFVEVPKFRFSGAGEVVKICQARNWSLDVVRITGVETNCCVLDTVEELHRQSPGSILELVQEACNDKVAGARLFPVHPNIRWVRQCQPGASIST